MNTITPLIKFGNIEVMNKFYDKFDKEAFEICRKYGVVEVWQNAKVIKDEGTMELGIVSLGANVVGSNSKKAVDEIIKTFESMFIN